MKLFLPATAIFLIFQCNQPELSAATPENNGNKKPYSSWADFLRDIPKSNGIIKDFSGRPISDQSKHYELVNYDVGTKDLQQCADFLIRLRAEYLFSKNRVNEISFRFTSGQAFSFKSYCEGITPVLKSGRIVFNQGRVRNRDHASLRKYLDHIYAYAGTVSLNRDLTPTNEFAVGTVIITPGTPGHCMIIVDEKQIGGEKRYKLAESFMPAQTPYILRNPEDDTQWYKLIKGRPIQTASFLFGSYNLRSFE